jgi:hypothetical protein
MRFSRKSITLSALPGAEDREIHPGAGKGQRWKENVSKQMEIKGIVTAAPGEAPTIPLATAAAICRAEPKDSASRREGFLVIHSES